MDLLRTKLVYILSIFLFLLAWPAMPIQSAELSAIDKTRDLQSQLQNFLRIEGKGQQDWRLLRDILLPFFDLRSVNQNMWEKAWINASELEKERILGYLAHYIIIEIDKNELSFKPNDLIYLNQQNSKDRAVVDTLIKIGNSRFPISLRFRKSNSSWLIYDIFLDELSLVEAWKELKNAINSSDSFEIILERIKSKKNNE